MPSRKSKSEKQDAARQLRRDPYEVLSISKNATDQEIKSAYCKMALKYHPDKNANDPKAADMFQEVTFSYSVLSDPIKRCQYDMAGFEVRSRLIAPFLNLEYLSRPLSATVLEKALNGAVTIRPLSLGQPVSRKVEKQCAHFYSVTIIEDEARAGFVCRVHPTEKRKFKLLYFDHDENGRLNLALQEDSIKTGKATSAGMFFLGFPVYRLDQTVNSVTAAKDPDGAFFKNLDGFQQCEISELKPGMHVFAIYGDNFFQSAYYTIEALCAAPFTEEKDHLRAVEAQILTKRAELSKFESEYREVCAQFNEMTSRYAQEMQEIDELFKKRNNIHASYTSCPPLKRSISKSKSKTSLKEEDHVKEKRSSAWDRPRKKKWYNNLHFKVDK